MNNKGIFSIIICCMIFLLSSCIVDIESKIEGKWKGQSLESDSIVIHINNSHFKLIAYYSDVMAISNGKLFFNQNEKRGLPTISFIPDKLLIDNDTIIPECFNYDIVELKDDLLIVEFPVDNRRMHSKDDVARNRIRFYRIN